MSLALAYMRQARVDWAVYARLEGDAAVADCARIHALRLACEKTGKSLRAAAGEDLEALRTSHKTLAVVVNLISRSRPIREDVTARRLDWRRWLTNLRRVAADVESIIPRSGYDGPNAEYPWLDIASGDAVVMSPATYAFERAMTTYGTQAWRTFCDSLRELAHNPRWAGSFNVDLSAL